MLDYRINSPNICKEMRSVYVPYLYISSASKDSRDLFLYSSYLFPPFIFRFTQNVVVWNVGDLDYIKRKNFNLETSHKAPEGGVVLISRDKGTIKSRYFSGARCCPHNALCICL